MLVLLPPSEGKERAAEGPGLDPAGLVFPALIEPRQVILDALVTLCEGEVNRACEGLGIGPRLVNEVERNAGLPAEPCAAAWSVYTGVLFQHFEPATLDPASKRRAARRFLIASALFGFTRPGDLIPAYRLAITARLPDLPPLASWWRPYLEEVVPPERLIVDLRSSAYAAAWRPPDSSVVVEVTSERLLPDGGRQKITHMAKAARGRVARVLAQAPGDPESADDLADLVRAAGEQVEMSGPEGGRGPFRLTIVER